MIYIFVFLFSFLVDYYSKNYVSKKLKWNGKKSYINDFIQLIYVENKGIAFNMLENRFFLISITNFLLLSYILYLFFVIGEYKLALTLIFSGGLGNFVDRLKRGYVVDYIYFNIKKFPVFNLSDFYIIAGVVLFSI